MNHPGASIVAVMVLRQQFELKTSASQNSFIFYPEAQAWICSYSQYSLQYVLGVYDKSIRACLPVCIYTLWRYGLLYTNSEIQLIALQEYMTYFEHEQYIENSGLKCLNTYRITLF